MAACNASSEVSVERDDMEAAIKESRREWEMEEEEAVRMVKEAIGERKWREEGGRNWGVGEGGGTTMGIGTKAMESTRKSTLMTTTEIGNAAKGEGEEDGLKRAIEESKRVKDMEEEEIMRAIEESKNISAAPLEEEKEEEEEELRKVIEESLKVDYRGCTGSDDFIKEAMEESRREEMERREGEEREEKEEIERAIRESMRG